MAIILPVRLWKNINNVQNSQTVLPSANLLTMLVAMAARVGELHQVDNRFLCLGDSMVEIIGPLPLSPLKVLLEPGRKNHLNII